MEPMFTQQQPITVTGDTLASLCGSGSGTRKTTLKDGDVIIVDVKFRTLDPNSSVPGRAIKLVEVNSSQVLGEINTVATEICDGWARFFLSCRQSGPVGRVACGGEYSIVDEGERKNEPLPNVERTLDTTQELEFDVQGQSAETGSVDVAAIVVEQLVIRDYLAE